MSAARPHILPPVDYNSADFGKIINRIYDDINSGINSTQTELQNQINRFSTSRRNDGISQGVSVRPQIIFNQIDIAVSGDDVKWGRFEMWFESGAQHVRSIEFRFDRGKIVDSIVPWLDMTSSSYNTTPLSGSYSGLTYKAGYIKEPDRGQGGFWRGEARIPHEKNNGVLVMQVKILGSATNEHGNWTYEFDANTNPRIIDCVPDWGVWNTGTNKFPLQISISADEDTGSLAQYVTTTDYAPTEIEDVADSNFTLIINGRSTRDTLIAEYSPSPIGGPAVTHYVLVRAYSKVNKGVVDLELPGATTFMRTIQAPDDPRDPSRLNPLSITSSQLVSVAQNVKVRLTTTRVDDDTFSTAGFIQHGDTTSYTVTGGNVTLPSSSLYYAFHDPVTWVGGSTEINYGANSAVAQIQFTTLETVAKAISGRRRFVGLAKKAAQATELVFAVMTGEKPVLTAPVIQVVDLYALQAKIGGINIGSSTIYTGGGNFANSDTGFYLGSNGNFSLKDKLVWTDSSSALVISGEITATSGAIGGFELGATTLTATNFILNSENQKLTLGTGNNIISIDAADDTYRLAIGHAAYASAPFSVTKAGVLTATNAAITGEITATSGSLTNLTISGTLTMGADGVLDFSSQGSIRFDSGSGEITGGSHPYFRGTTVSILALNTAYVTGQSVSLGSGLIYISENAETVMLSNDASHALGFHGGGPVVRQTITGGRDGSPALADLLTKLEAKGLIIDSTVAGTDVQDQDFLLDDISDLSDPGADRILFWDDSAGIMTWLTVGAGLQISGTTLGLVP